MTLLYRRNDGQNYADGIMTAHYNFNIRDIGELYQAAQKEVDEAMNQLEKTGLSREQNKVVDKALSATNASGAAYGSTAYKQGLYDGIKLMSEVRQISCDGGILNAKK